MLTLCSQLRCIDSRQVNAIAASRAVHVAISSITSTTSHLTLNTRRNRLVSDLRSSKDDPLSCGRDRRNWHVPRYVYMDTTCANLSPSFGRFGRHDFVRLR